MRTNPIVLFLNKIQFTHFFIKSISDSLLIFIQSYKTTCTQKNIWNNIHILGGLRDINLQHEILILDHILNSFSEQSTRIKDRLKFWCSSGYCFICSLFCFFFLSFVISELFNELLIGWQKKTPNFFFIS